MKDKFNLTGVINFKLSEVKLGEIIFPELLVSLKPGVNIVTAPSGRGKTTFISRLIGLRGKTEIHNSERYTGSFFSFFDAKSMIAYLSQENIIVGESFCDALNYYGNPIFDDEYFKILVSNLQIDFLPNNCNSIIYNDNSLMLSGGQVRKTLIIQTLMLDRLIYIFDEPTSSFDENSSNLFFNYMQKAFPERYFLIITHDNIVHNYKDFHFIEL
jgi:ABC-type transport system involved in cytochrome bd biosynthesis fused ATPase/permease subunit